MVNLLDFVDDGDDDGGVASGVKEDARDVFFDFVFGGFKVWVVGTDFVSFGAEVVADFTD